MNRVSRLGSTLEKDMLKYFKTLGQSKIRQNDDMDRYRMMADQIVKAHEYQHFFDVVQSIRNVGEV